MCSARGDIVRITQLVHDKYLVQQTTAGTVVVHRGSGTAFEFVRGRGALVGDLQVEYARRYGRRPIASAVSAALDMLAQTLVRGESNNA